MDIRLLAFRLTNIRIKAVRHHCQFQYHIRGDTHNFNVVKVF